MEATPQQDLSQASENLTGTFESSSGYESHSYNSSSYIETPTTSINPRKRKFSTHGFIEKKSKFKSTNSSTPMDFDSQCINLYFMSSTLNESLTNKLEKCTINSYTPNFYVENSSTNNELILPEKIEEDRPKSRSAPSTPTKQILESSRFSKSKSEELENHYTPIKTNCLKPLGSPESNKILYSNIPENTPAKLKSPQKFVESIKKLNSPAKKRLFEGPFRKPFKKIDRDPISVFRIKHSCPRIISAIFGYLSDVDLYHVSMVSKIWKTALIADEKAFHRYLSYIEYHKSNKENLSKTTFEPLIACLSPPHSPERENFTKCTQLVATLKPSQSLLKCPRCWQFAVLEKTIGQCQNSSCEYIWCRNCSSFSVTGPANFHDKCHKSKLVLEAPPVRRSLLDISNATTLTDSMSSFFTNSTPINVLSSYRHDSSGYVSENEISSPRSSRRNSSSPFVFHNKTNALRDFNRNSATFLRRPKRSPPVPVVESTSPKRPEITEPSSPPRIKVPTAGSKQSKKNLKRLKF